MNVRLMMYKYCFSNISAIIQRVYNMKLIKARVERFTLEVIH